MEPRVFQLDPVAQAVVTRRRLIWTLAFAIALSGGFQLFYWWLGRGRPGQLSGTASIIVFLTITPLLVVVMVRATRRSARSYRLTLADDWLRIDVQGLLPIEVRRDQVRRLREGPGGVEIFRDGLLPAGIPSTLDGFAEVRDRVRSWAPAAPPPATGLSSTALGILNTAAVIALFVLSGLSYVMSTPVLSFVMAGLASACGWWLWWAFRALPVKRRWVVRGYMVVAAVGVLLMNALRWTMMRGP